MASKNITVELIKKYLAQTNGDLIEAAKISGIKYGTFSWWIRKHDIPFNNKNKINATKEQLEEAYNRLGSLSLVAKELGGTKEGVRCRMQVFGLEIKELVRHTVDDDFFSRDTEESFYWAGFLAADGCVKSHRRNREDICIVYLALQLADKSHIEKFTKITNYSGNIYEGTVKTSKNSLIKKNYKKAEISITSRKMVKDLKRFNIFPRKSLVYCPPKELVLHPLFNHFLRGYFDGDGSIYSNMGKRSVTITYFFNVIGSLDFMNIYKGIFEKENLVKNGHKIIPCKKDQTNNLMRLEYGGNGVMKKIREYLYRDAKTYLQRKWDKFQAIPEDKKLKST